MRAEPYPFFPENMSLVIHIVDDSLSCSGEALQAVLGKPQSEAEQRSELFEGASTEDGNEGATKDKSVRGKAGASEAFSAASEARDKLVERGEKISALADKTDKLQQGAEDFASLTKKLRQKQEAKNSWFGFF